MIQHKKTIISFAIVGIILCASLMVSGCTDYETYTNDDYGFSLQYPETWNIKEESMDDGIDGMTVDLTSPDDRAGVQLYVLDLSSLDTVNEYSYTGYDNYEDSPDYSDMSLEDFVKEFGPYEIDGVDINIEQTTFNEQEAYEATTKGLSDVGEEVQTKQIIFLDRSIIEGNKGYVLTYYAKPYAAYEENLKTADKIMNSFSFDTN